MAEELTAAEEDVVLPLGRILFGTCAKTDLDGKGGPRMGAVEEVIRTGDREGCR